MRQPQQRGEMVGGECGGHRQGWQHRPQRQHGLDALAGRQYVISDPEANGVPKQVTHGLPPRIDQPCPAFDDGRV